MQRRSPRALNLLFSIPSRTAYGRLLHTSERTTGRLKLNMIVFYWQGILALAFISHWLTPTLAQGVSIQTTGFQALPDRMFYFKNSEVRKKKHAS